MPVDSVIRATPYNANAPSFFKVGDLAQLVKTLAAYWLGTLLEIASSNPDGSMKKYFTCIFIVIQLTVHLPISQRNKEKVKKV